MAFALVVSWCICCIPFNVVKTMGRWSSHAFSLYLQMHASILALYIQSTPVLELFVCIAMPRCIH
ncbi:hypothetical protein BKA70DRAFT_1131129 [Coprinopsis sp. MPI-PUGE-AT-0042]|nr:hypothetical protein BKA70DRAFT_1131129 [Coprinopsis sp. MPI-PUGE-AT-0042]